MKIWSLADLHLNIGVPEKDMGVFGPTWENYTKKIKKNWIDLVSTDDIVLVAGDISWAMKTKEVVKDLAWINELPGTKILLKGNHDHWWTSRNKVIGILPPTIKIVHYDSLQIGDVAIGGGRLWDTEEYTFEKYIVFKENPRAKHKEIDKAAEEKQFEKELGRLRLSLESMDPKAPIRIAMTHYPPIGADLRPSKASQILEEFNIQYCTFGHLHNVRPGTLPFGEKNGVEYRFAAADYIDFKPILIKEL